MINISFELLFKGWFKASILDDKNEVSLFGSRLSDGLSEFAISAWLLAEGRNDIVTCSWQEEPGQYRWIFSRKNNEISVRILWFEDTFSRYSNDKGKEIFSSNEDMLKFLRTVIRAFDRLLFQYGTDNYKYNWTYEFPKNALDRLKLLFKALKKTLSE